eukprot:3803193-Rhodomonas_salina.1
MQRAAENRRLRERYEAEKREVWGFNLLKIVGVQDLVTGKEREVTLNPICESSLNEGSAIRTCGNQRVE